MRTAPPRSFARRLVALAAGVALLPALAGPVLAEDGEGGDGAEALQAKIKAQMEKVIRLMRENQKALLEASLGSAKKPEGAAVEPPETPKAPDAPPTGGPGEPGMAGGPPPPSGPKGGDGEAIRREIDELIKTTQASGGAIPNELEELVRMIPTQGGGGGGGGGDPSAGSDPRRDLPNPDEPQAGKQPKDGEKKDGEKPKSGETPPPEADKGPAADGGPPAWFTSLPDTVRRAIVSGKTDDVPPKYRARIEMYRKWLAKQAGDRK